MRLYNFELYIGSVSSKLVFAISSLWWRGYRYDLTLIRSTSFFNTVALVIFRLDNPVFSSKTRLKFSNNSWSYCCWSWVSSWNSSFVVWINFSSKKLCSILVCVRGALELATSFVVKNWPCNSTIFPSQIIQFQHKNQH